MNKEIQVLTIERAWLEKPSSDRVNYVVVDPDETHHELVTPRGSALGKILLKEIREVELDEAQEAEDTAAADRDIPRPANVRDLASGIAAHPYGSAGDDSGEVSVAPPVGRSFLAGSYPRGVQW